MNAAPSLPLSGSRILEFGGRDRVLRIEKGAVELFLKLRDREENGRRTHFATLEAGAWIFDVGLGGGDEAGALIAVGQPGTVVRPLEGALAPSTHPDLVEGLNTWTGSLQSGIARVLDQSPTRTEFLVVGAESAAAGVLGVREEPVWWSPGTTPATYFGCEPIDSRIVPLSVSGWVDCEEPVGNGLTLSTREFLSRDSWLDDLARGHVLLLRTMRTAVHRETEDEKITRQNRARLREAAGARGWQQIASVLGPENREGLPDFEAGSRRSINLAFARVCQRLKIPVPPPRPRSTPDDAADAGTVVAELSRAAGVRSRTVLLAGDWWRQDAGPLIAILADSGEAVALIYEGGRYVAWHADESRQTVGRAQRGDFQPSAFCLYRSLPNRKLTFHDIRKFSLFGNGRDFLRIGFLVVLTGLLGLATPALTSRIFDIVIPQSEREIMLHITVALVAAAVVRVLLELSRGLSLIRVENRTDAHLQAAVWDRILKLPTRFFRNFTSGDLASRAQGISDIRAIMSNAGSTLLFTLPTGLFNFLVMFWNDTRLSWWGLGIAIVAVLVSVGLGWAQMRLVREQLDIQGRLSGMVFQIINGVARFRLAAAEDLAFAAWAKEYAAQSRLSMSVGRWQVALNAFFSGFTLLASAILFAVVAYSIEDPTEPGAYGAPTLTTGSFLAFYAAFGALVCSLIMAAQGSMQLLAIFPLLERTKPIFEAEPEIHDERPPPGVLSGSIELANVNFSYAEGLPLVLREVSIRIEPGEFVAIVGPSGSGKSTILRLLLGFEQADSGVVLYDGQDIQTVDAREVRRQIGVVLQSSTLMPGDLFRNIVGESTLTQDDAWRAAEMAGLADDIRAMPMQMNTVVSEGGSGFSGGQRQRITISRALAHNPKILFFDEATSALDNRTQAIVTASLDALQATRIVIAHRLSTIAQAGRIIVLDKGQIVEEGTYEALMSKQGTFFELARRQLAETDGDAG